MSHDKYDHTNNIFSENDMSLVTRKGIYPYNYIDSWDKLEEVELPSKEYYNHLEVMSDDDYVHAINVLNHFKYTTLGEYSDLYLLIDILLLCNIFENFRSYLFKITV